MNRNRDRLDTDRIIFSKCPCGYGQKVYWTEETRFNIKCLKCPRCITDGWHTLLDGMLVLIGEEEQVYQGDRGYFTIWSLKRGFQIVEGNLEPAGTLFIWPESEEEVP